MYDLIWDLYQQREISRAKWEASSASSKARASAQRAEELEGAIDRLLLITHALWEIQQNVHGLTDQDLVTKMQEIDMRDGRLDGKLRKRELRNCKQCGRVLNQKHPRCIYCGSQDFDARPFSSVT